MTSFFRRTLAGTALATTMLGAPGLATAAQTTGFNVPAQDVAAAVRQFGRQSHVQIVVAGRVAQGRRTHAIAGAMSVDEALAHMLAGTGLSARKSGEDAYVIVPNADEAAAIPADEAPAIIVTGVLEAQREAVAEKREAENVVETLHANDVGKLPDQNVAEAIKRLPGLTAANDQGEGRYAVIRGIDPALANVTLNGMTQPAPEPDGRQVKLDDLPSAMIQSVTVSKSLLASQDANAIAGEVAIRTKTAFDSKKPFFFDARASAGAILLNNKVPYEIDGTLGGRFGAERQFGAVVSVNYSRRPIESENYQGSSAATYAATGVPDGNGLRDYNLTRTRLGIVGNFDWHPSDKVKIYLRTSYSEFEDHETRDQNRLAVTGYDSTTGAPSKATATILVRRREENDHTIGATLGGDFSDIAGGHLEMAGGYTRAVKKDPIRSEFTFTTAKSSVTSLNYDPSTNPYTLTPSGSFSGLFADPSKFYFSKYNFEQRYAYEEIWQGKIDYSHPIPLGSDSEVKLGAKLLDRHKADDHNKTTWNATKTAWYLSNVGYTGNTGFYGNEFDFGTRINYFAARDYLTANMATYATVNTSSTISDSLSSDYDVRETIAAGYVMARLKFGNLTVIPGVRVEATHDSTKAKLVTASSTLAQGFNSFGSVGYIDVFPGLNVKFEASRKLQVRGAVTTSIGRPNYPQLAPYVIVDTSTPSIPAITLGNPDLKPYRAVNLDAAVEFYPMPGSIVSAGIFHKDIDNPIYSYTRTGVDGTYAAVAYTNASVTQPINASSESITGVEFNIQHQFQNLPGALSGFGFSGNFSHTWGHAGASEIRASAVPLAYQSKNVATAQIFYEKYGFTARLAFSYRSAYLDTLGASATLDQYTDANGQLDFHASYQIRPAITVFGDAVNLTDAPWRRYLGAGTSYLIERERYGPSLRGGVQVHF
ncbi:TonB-dependent receptor [Novosphingobium nitrogenifigens DSM 19370]|uniref:TonB-dependent receptor n=1 Tax=Novosphingobium nitrogenifigens DSM 19370 TaxID=983920 RepID=F1Z9L8_9SPHN|nr:TonB-dependent receptor [Novosphingobium nitrogenifigens]EGD58724.1 TonB-dependent receptor [Novosphingobium nitrogenifigens DSM 19370]